MVLDLEIWQIAANSPTHQRNILAREPVNNQLIISLLAVHEEPFRIKPDLKLKTENWHTLLFLFRAPPASLLKIIIYHSTTLGAGMTSRTRRRRGSRARWAKSGAGQYKTYYI